LYQKVSIVEVAYIEPDCRRTVCDYGRNASTTKIILKTNDLLLDYVVARKEMIVGLGRFCCCMNYEAKFW
jgi:hypothetical protein